MVKILFLMDNITEGGAEKVLRNLVNNMDQEQFQITVQTVEEADAKRYLVPGIRYKAINRCKSRIGKKLFHYWIRLCAEVNWVYPLYIKDDYDIEVAYLECGPTKFLSGSTNKNALKLAWVHCDLVQRGTTAAKKLLSTYSHYDKIVCVSNTVKTSFQSIFGTSPEAVVLHNVNDEADIQNKAAAFSVEHPKEFTFLFVGRLSYEKGGDRLLNACARLKDSGLVFRVSFVGDGDRREELESQVKSLGLQDHIRFHGFQSNPYPYIASADCIVCPSRYEGFSTVVTEALILGKPVIATPCSGMDELLGDSEYGIVTEDSTDSIAKAMQRIIFDPKLLFYYQVSALNRGRQFSKKSVIENTQQFLLSELEQKRAK